MARLAQFTLAGVLVGLASAQSQSQSQSQSALVTQIFFPLADPQALDASIIAQSPDATTILMNCAPGVASDDCGFPDPITLTVGPSTLHYAASGIYQVFGDIDCKLTASATADCTVAAGLYSDAADPSGTATGDDAYITTPAASSSTTSGVFSGSEVSWLDITITAGLEKATGSVTGTATSTGTSSSGVGSSSRSGTGSESGSGTVTGTSASRTGTSSAAVASATGNVAAGSSKTGYAGLGVAAVLVAGSMVML